MKILDRVKTQAEALPEHVLEKVLEFIEYQKYSNDLYDGEDEYLDSIPGMPEIIKEGLATPLSECISLSDVRKGVRR